MAAPTFADPEMVKLWDEAVQAHRDKTAVNLRNEENKRKSKLFVKFWNSLKPAPAPPQPPPAAADTKPTEVETFELELLKPKPGQVRELVDDLTRDYEEFQKLRNGDTKVTKIRHFLGQYAATMAGLGVIVESVVEDSFPPAALVAVAFTHIMTSFVAVTADLDLIENLFEIMTSFAERLGLLRKIPQDRRFRNLILKTFTYMLEFCTNAHSRLQKDRYRTKEWAKALFRGQDEKLKEAYDRVVTVIDDMDKATVTQTLASLLEFEDNTERTLQRGFSRMDSGFMKMNTGLNMVLTNQRHESLRSQRRDEETRGFRAEVRKNNDKIINILLEKNASKAGSDARKVNSLEIITKSLFTGAEYFLAQRWAKIEREYVKDTYAWFDADYERLKDMDGGVVFITGASGMGKSFFSYAIASRLARDFDENPTTSVASFMFDQDNEKLETVANMLYFCSAQVASKVDSYRQHIQKLVDNVDDRKSGWREEPWKYLFAEKFAKTSESSTRLYLVLDGIDQLESWEVDALVGHLRDAEEKCLRINFIISGTPEMRERIVKVDKEVRLVREIMAPDFKLFAKSRIDSQQGLAGHPQSLKDKIADAMEQSADTFFYVTHMLRQLDLMRIGSLIESSIRPAALPESTDAIYHRLFEECEQYFPNTNERKALGYLFTWLAYSYSKITLDAAQTLVDLIMVSILGEKRSTLDIKVETLGRLSKILAFSEPLEDVPEINGFNFDNGTGQSEGLGRIARRKDNGEPEVLLTFQQHSLRDYFSKHPERSVLLPSEHDTCIMMFQMSVAVLAAPDQKVDGKTSEGHLRLNSIAVDCVFHHFLEAQPLLSDEEAKSVSQALYRLLGQGDLALRKIEQEYKFMEDSPDALDDCSIFGSAGNKTKVNNVLKSLVDLGVRVGKLPPAQTAPLSPEAANWIKSTLNSRYSILTSIALGHIRNWFSEATVLPSHAYAAFRFAHVALWTLTEEERKMLMQTTGVKLTEEHFPKELKDECPDSTFELIATLGHNPLTPRDHKQISKAMQFDLRNKGSKEQAEKGLKLAKDPRDIFDLRYRIARARFDEFVYPEWDSVDPDLTPESVIQAWETCLKDIPSDDPDGSLATMLNAAYQMKARVESTMKDHHTQALASMEQARKMKTSESFPRFFEEMVVAFGDERLWHEIIQLLGTYENPLKVKCRDLTHRFIHRAAMSTGKKELVRDLYRQAAENPDEVNGADEAEIRIWLASFEWFVMSDPERAKEELRGVLKSKQSGFLWSEKAGRKLADILLEGFRMSRELPYKLRVLSEMEEVIQTLQNRLGLEFKPELSQTSTTLALMRRKLGPAESFYTGANKTFRAACDALDDMTETNDTPSLRLLAKVLSLLPGRTEDAQIALSCQFYLLPPPHKDESGDEIDGGGSEQEHPLIDSSSSSALRKPAEGATARGAIPSAAAVVVPVVQPTAEENAKYDFNNYVVECAFCNKTISSFSQGKIYTCVYCTHVDLCEECYLLRRRKYTRAGEGDNHDHHDAGGMESWKTLRDNKLDDGSYVEVCPWGHELIESPVKGWKGVKDGVVMYDGKKVKFGDWLSELRGGRGRWAKAWGWYWREVSDE
ncbi:hypothetical protein QBC42DRAFT_214335 [Cladorrhinum samala]|uniref:Fungal STAND N-terminal Goodbye domain-containing protein n=1 Tax=Cladorrhinum samala TaxID=585594 RepID=A0AAV9H9Y4_9PEZI|nr:hypothetical protein QBC42DRAFT_214335 [Cladorrhinum samala]